MSEVAEAQVEEAVVDTPVEATAESLLSQPAADDNAWYLADGIKGEGDKPEFFDNKRFKSIDQQAKSYLELEKKLGAHTGAPKDGYAVPEGYDQDDELVKQAMERAGKYGINQAAFNDMFDLLSESSGVSQEITIEGEMAKLGENAEKRIESVTNFLKNNAGENFDEIISMVTTAESVELLERVVNAIAPQKMPVNDSAVSGNTGWDDIEKLMHEKDDFGRLRRSSDPAFNAKVENMIKEYGERNS